jgi:phenylacetate-CoA ligase
VKMILCGEDLPSDLSLSALDAAFSSENVELMRSRASEVPVCEIVDVLERTALLFVDEKSRYYREAMASLPSALGYSPAMVRLGLNALPQMLSRKSLMERLHVLPSPWALDAEVVGPGGRLVRAIPVGLVTHVAAGNIFLGSIDSLVYGMITKNINVLKCSRQDKIFPRLFLDALRECDVNRVLIPFVSLLYWGREDVAIEDFFKKKSDLLLVFGGADAVSAWRNGVGGKTEVAACGPKLSCGVVDGGLTNIELEAAAQGFATDVILWEQRACTSCQNIFIEDGASVEPFVASLVNALEKEGLTLPRAALPLDESVEILRERELAMWEAFSTGGHSHVARNGDFAVIVRKGRDVVDSPLNRTVFVNIVSSLDDILLGNIQNLRSNLSTVGVAIRAEREQHLTSLMSSAGVLRFCAPGQMVSSNDERAPHDGVHLVQALIRLISFEGLSPRRHGTDFVNRSRRERLILSRLNHIVAISSKAPFYARRHGHLKFPLGSLKEFSECIPVLEKADLLLHSPESSVEMLTHAARDAYLFSAGGTTGSMKYVMYSHQEFRHSQRVFGEGFRNTAIGSKDVVANCFRSGAFWTAFLATNGGLEQTGCCILSMGGNQSEKDSIAYLQRFRPNVMMGVPSSLLLMAQEAERMGEDVSIERIGYAGEHLSQEARKYFSRVFKTQRFFSLGYAAVETGPIGFQCQHCASNEHHPCDDWVFVESDEAGDIFVTTLARELQPLLRFRVGDRIEWVSEPCACGRSSRKFRLRERSDDVVMFAVSHLNLSSLSKILDEFSGLDPVYRVVVEPREALLFVRIEVETSAYADEMLASRVRDRVVMVCPCFGVDVEENGIGELRIVLLAPGGIERVERTGKVRRVVDARV